MLVLCAECELEVASKAALLAHWREQRDQDKQHYHCLVCVRLFHTPEAERRHHKELHAAKQDLACPGCDERFGSAGGLVDHIERNRCKRIKNDDFVARREEKLAFARELERRHHGEDVDLANDLPIASLGIAENTASTNGPYNFTQCLSRAKDTPAGTPSPSSLRPKVEHTAWPSPVTFVTKKAEFPHLWVKQTDDLTEGAGGNKENRARNAWAEGKKLFPDAPAAVLPTPEQLDVLQKPTKTKPIKEVAWPEHDPRNPLWDPGQYFVTYTGKYKCPHNRCPKSFPHVAALRGHLLSAKHAGLLRVQCPHCCKWFDSSAALTTHASSQSTRCNIRATDGYRPFLDQVSAGMLDTTEKHDDGTEKYTVPDGARVLFGTSQSK